MKSIQFFQENLKRKQEEVEFNSTKKQEEMIKHMKRKIEDLEDEKREQVKARLSYSSLNLNLFLNEKCLARQVLQS